MSSNRSRTRRPPGGAAADSRRGPVGFGLLRTGALAAVFLALWTAANWGSLTELVIAQSERDQEAAEVERLELVNAAMEEERAALLEDQGALEWAAREEELMAYPGEIVVLLDRTRAED